MEFEGTNIDVNVLSKVIISLLRNGFVLALVLFLVCPKIAAAENLNSINVARMIKFDINSHTFGSKAASGINSMEVQVLNTQDLSSITHRKLVLARFENVTVDQFLKIKDKAGAILFTLPLNLQSLSDDIKENIFLLERAILFEDININIYFAKHCETLSKIIQDISGSAPGFSGSAFSEIINKISANGIVVNIASTGTNPSKNSKLPVISGELTTPNKHPAPNSNIPVIIVTTQIKTFGLVSSVPGTESSSVMPNYDTMVLLSLIDAFSKLYSNLHSAPKYRIIFMLSEGAYLLNFNGVKKWLDLNTESNLLGSVEFAINIDSLVDLDDLFMMVSKPPKEGAAVFRFFEVLKKKAQIYGHKSTVEVQHKKINLNDQFFKYSHERFSMKKINAFTLTSLKNFDNELRTTIFSQHSTEALLEPDSQLDAEILENIGTNTKILAEALGNFVFDVDENDEIFKGPLTINPEPYLWSAKSTMSRSQNIKLVFEKFLRNVKVLDVKPDKSDPEFQLYDESGDAKLNIYNVKPAVFDLFMTLMISAYLFGVYLVIVNFGWLYEMIQPKKSEANHKNN